MPKVGGSFHPRKIHSIELKVGRLGLLQVATHDDAFALAFVRICKLKFKILDKPLTKIEYLKREMQKSVYSQNPK
jgi:hypothetical protein